MNLRQLIGACAVALIATPAFAQKPTAAGSIKVASGSAFIVRDGASLPVKTGQAVFEADSLRTGADGRVGITLKDDTRVSIGPSSEVRLSSFVYAPSDGQLGLALKFIRGVAVYVSGRIAKLAPDSVRLETPAAVLGVRGTTLAIRVEE
jgi:hypothetical protein